MFGAFVTGDVGVPGDVGVLANGCCCCIFGCVSGVGAVVNISGIATYMYMYNYG